MSENSAPEPQGRVLVVDDSRVVHQMFGAHLEAVGYVVLHAPNGITGINMAFTEQPDLIVVDINMPDINGYQVCRLLKDHPATRDIPIVIATGNATNAVVNPKNWSFQTGADGYIEKDLSGRFLEQLKPFLGRKRPPAVKCQPLTELDILLSLSNLLDKQLYADVTRLNDLNERKNAFVSNVAHEFKSPLTVLAGYLESLKDGEMGPVNAEQTKAAGVSLQVVHRLARLVSDMLDLAQIEAGRVTLRLERVDLQQLLDETLETYAGLINENGLTVQRDFPAERVVLAADSDRLAQVFINVLNNSIKYTPKGGTIGISLRHELEGACVKISDSGPGIPPEYIDKIFDKFERVSSRKYEGTGLGLPIARDIVLLHGGKLWAESSPGKGSTFVTVLPINIPGKPAAAA